MNTPIPTWALAALLTAVGFVVGAIPFSLLVGRLALATDIRRYGDGNPGATNVLRAGHARGGGLATAALAFVAAFLDMLKGALPVAVAYVILELRGPEAIPMALAPVLGHLTSPFLRGHGGKGVAVTGGIWIGLTYGVATVIGIVFMTIGYLMQRVAGWAVALGLTAIGGYLLIWQRDPVLLSIWAGNTLLILWRHREDLGSRPQWRSWWRKRLRS